MCLQDQEKTKTSICTFLSVLVHLDIILPGVQDKVRASKCSIHYHSYILSHLR